jgi:FHS family L-fucose permease-like MFS transporter
LNDVLIRQFMKSFEISRLQAGLVQSAFYAGYFTLSIPAAMIMQRRGYKAGLITGLMLYSCGTFLFLPAAHTRSYALFLFALFVIASGLAFLETGANPLIAQMGDQETAVRRLNFSQAFNPFGAITGVLVGTIFIFSGVELNATDIARLKLGGTGTYTAYLEHETMRVIAPYLVLGVVVLIWGLLILRTQFPSIASENSSSPVWLGNYKELFKYPHLLLAILTQFCYVGAQVGTWSYFIQYIQDYVHLPEKTAGYLLTGTLVGFGVGRFSSSRLMKTMPANKLMGAFALINMALVALAVIFPGWIGTIAIFMTSFFMSLMFPTIFALGIRGLGPHTKAASSLIVMAIIGGAVFTPLMGFVFQMTQSMALAMLVPLGCYLVVAFYALRGCELRSMAAQEM